ncbi:hypothetical protein N5C36_07965 [Shewanella xiamenensis]|nr:hypothetical protein [Shewanella xiamenensis]MDH1314022.1 hypothetical protein [Shewanella xiamenensis]
MSTPASPASLAQTSNTPLASIPYSASSAIPSEANLAAVLSSTKSRLVSTKVKLLSGKSARICRCSRVCGITPSSQANTSNAWRTWLTPTSMLLMNFSWPGTSIKAKRVPSRSGIKA